MNDKCAAGTGRFLEVMARALEIELEEMGDLSLQSDEVVSIISRVDELVQKCPAGSHSNSENPHYSTLDVGSSMLDVYLLSKIWIGFCCGDLSGCESFERNLPMAL